MTTEDEAINFESDEAELEPMIEAAAALVEYAQGEEFGRDVEEIITRVIETVNPTERGEQLVERLGAYFDHNDEVAHALLLLLAFPPEETVDLIPVAEVASGDEADPLRTALRRLSGLFGPDLLRATDASDFGPDNWAQLQLSYSYFPTAGLWNTELEITKFDESRVRIDGPAESFLKMINYVLAEMTSMPADAGAFADELEEFRVAANEFLHQYE